MSAATPLILFNSLTRRHEPFEPIHPGEARVYSCGPTVYNFAHIGNMRAYVFADVLGRALTWKGYVLRHVINITDVGHLTDDGDTGEDKLERAAQAGARSIWEIARSYTEAYWADVRALNIREPAQWSIATDYVPEMIAFAQTIAERHCYQLDTGLYFDIGTVADYGRLARAPADVEVDANESGARIEAVAGKRHPADFAIWRATPAGETRQMEWDSPWGKGAPGWHLECSVMSGKLLGFPFDIHTGGIDHREIHHPNEIAQNQAYVFGGEPACCGSLDEPAHSGARMWLHNNFLVLRADQDAAGQSGSGKMSKSAGEFLRLQLLVDRGYHPIAYRLMCLQAHYRGELEFSWNGLTAALTRLKRIVIAVGQLRGRGEVDAVPGPRLAPFIEQFDAAISDDLNTPVALTVLEAVLALKKTDPAEKLAAVEAMDGVLGLGLASLRRADLRIRPTSAVIDEAAIAATISRRSAARAAKDFAMADSVRDELVAQGVEVMDGDPLGWDWKLA